MARRNYGSFTPRRQQALKRAAMISAATRRGRPRYVAGNRRVGTRVVGTRTVRTRAATRAHVQRNRRKYVAAGVVIGAAAGGAVGYDRTVNVRLYHNTDKRNIASIKKHGLHGTKVGSYSHINFQESPGQVFVSRGANKSKQFGNHVVKIKMNRKEFNRNATRDRNMSTRRAMKIHESHLYGKKIRTYPAGPGQRIMYKTMFPGGTKESYKYHGK